MTISARLSAVDPKLMFERIGGIPVLERQLFTAARAGIGRVWVEADKPDPRELARLRLPPNLEVSWRSDGANRPDGLILSGEHFIRVEALRQIALGLPLPPDAVIRLDAGARKIEDWLLKMGPKSQDGFMARNFDRRISLAISRRLLPTAVAPNMMTLASCAIGLAGAAFFLHPSHAPRLTGAVLIWLHSVLDGCDGELARIRFQESAFGRAIDFWGDNLVHLALFGCMATGFYKADGGMVAPLLGLAASVGTIGSAVLVYRDKSSRNGAPSDPAAKDIGTLLTRVEDMLAARDFIYLLLFLAYIDRTYEFLWATGVGSLLFFAMMLYLRRKNNEKASRPHPPREGEIGNTPAGHGGGHQHVHSGRRAL